MPPVLSLMVLLLSDIVVPSTWMPPAPTSAVLPLTVLLLTVNDPEPLKMPPPQQCVVQPTVVLPLIVLLLRVNDSPPPRAEMPLQWLPLTVLLLRVNVPQRQKCLPVRAVPIPDGQAGENYRTASVDIKHPVEGCAVDQRGGRTGAVDGHGSRNIQVSVAFASSLAPGMLKV